MPEMKAGEPVVYRQTVKRTQTYLNNTKTMSTNEKSVVMMNCGVEGGVFHYSCTQCNATFRSKSNCTKHIRTVHLNRTELCNICGKAYKKVSQHKADVHSNTEFKCDLCDRKFTSKRCLKRHRAEHHKPSGQRVGVRVQCEVCRAEVSQAKFNQHMEIVHFLPPEFAVPCPLCSTKVKFLPFHFNKAHTEINVRRELYPCRKCRQYFLKHDDLKAHEKFHLTFCCQVCGKDFPEFMQLGWHAWLVHRRVFNPGLKNRTKRKIKPCPDPSRARLYQISPRDDIFNKADEVEEGDKEFKLVLQSNEVTVYVTESREEEEGNTEEEGNAEEEEEEGNTEEAINEEDADDPDQSIDLLEDYLETTGATEVTTALFIQTEGEEMQGTMGLGTMARDHIVSMNAVEESVPINEGTRDFTTEPQYFYVETVQEEVYIAVQNVELQEVRKEVDPLEVREQVHLLDFNESTEQQAFVKNYSNPHASDPNVEILETELVLSSVQEDEVQEDEDGVQVEEMICQVEEISPVEEKKINQIFSSKINIPRDVRDLVLPPEDEEVLISLVLQQDGLEFRELSRLQISAAPEDRRGRDASNRHKFADSRQAHVCPFCRMVLKTRYTLKMHLKVKHLQGKHISCDVCSKDFATQSDLKKHRESSHEPQVMVRCEVCGKEVRSGYISRHRQFAHRAGQPCQCDVCGKPFKNREIMLQHRRNKHK